MSKIIEGHVCRKVQKLVQVALSEHNKTTSLFYKNYPDLTIDNMQLYFYIWLPECINVNKIRNVLKKIYKLIFNDIPDIINLNFNIIQTFGTIEKKCWFSQCGFSFALHHSTHKRCKLRNINDIKRVLKQFVIEQIETSLSDTFFINY